MLPKFSFALMFLLLASLSAAVKVSEQQANGATTSLQAAGTERAVLKRSLSAVISEAGFGGPWTATASRFPPSFGGANVGGWNPWNSYSPRLISSPSPSEVANAIAAAKQASANVLISQQQMQAAKENVLNQQRIAMEKETAAAILTQKSEAAAAIQRSEAAAAAQGVVLAQQRLAASKAAVSHQQRIAAAREAEAAAALQRSAHAAAAEIQKTEYEASRFGQYTRNNNAGVAHHLALTKDAAFSAINAGINHVPSLESLGPWSPAGLLGGSGSGGAAKPPAAGGWA